MLRYKLRTLLVVLALGPVVIAVCWRAFTGGQEEQAMIGAVFFTLVAAWLCSRAASYLTRM